MKGHLDIVFEITYKNLSLQILLRSMIIKLMFSPRKCFKTILSLWISAPIIIKTTLKKLVTKVGIK